MIEKEVTKKAGETHMEDVLSWIDNYEKYLEARMLEDKPSIDFIDGSLMALNTVKKWIKGD